VKLCLAHVICSSFAVERASFARIASRGRYGAFSFLFRPSVLKKTNSKNWKITRYSDKDSTSIFRLRDLGWHTIVQRNRTLYTILSGDAVGRNDDICRRRRRRRRIQRCTCTSTGIQRGVVYVVPLANLVRDFSHAL
jgi:hypothetical protein